MRPKLGQNQGSGGGLSKKRRGFGFALFWAVLMPTSAWAADPTASEQGMVLAAVASGAVALAIAAGLWALAEQNSGARLRRLLRHASARTRAAVG